MDTIGPSPFPGDDLLLGGLGHPDPDQSLTLLGIGFLLDPTRINSFAVIELAPSQGRVQRGL